MIYSRSDFKQILVSMVETRFSDEALVNAFLKLLFQDREAVKGELLYLLEPRGDVVTSGRTTMSGSISDMVVIKQDSFKLQCQNELLEELRESVEALYA